MDQTKSYVSCCVEVNNIERVLYVAPKKTMPAKKDDTPAEKQRISGYAGKTFMCVCVSLLFIFVLLTFKTEDMKSVANEFINLAKTKFNVQHIKTKWVTKTYAMDNNAVRKNKPKKKKKTKRKSKPKYGNK
jgi:hypothetical protein